MGAVLTHGSVAERQAVVGAAGARAGADGAWSERAWSVVSASTGEVIHLWYSKQDEDPFCTAEISSSFFL